MATLHILSRRPVDPRDFLRLVDFLADRFGRGALTYTVVDLASGESRSVGRGDAAGVDLEACMLCARGAGLTACATNAPLDDIVGNVYLEVDGVAPQLLAELVAERLDWWLAAASGDDDHDTLPLLSMLEARYAGYRERGALVRHLASTLVVELGVDPEVAAEEAARAAEAAGLSYPWWGDPRTLYDELRRW